MTVGKENELPPIVMESPEVKAAAMKVELSLKAEPDLPDAALDAASIRRMLNNLIWNAMEACRKDDSKDRHRVQVRAGRYDDTHFKFEIDFALSPATPTQSSQVVCQIYHKLHEIYHLSH